MEYSWHLYCDDEPEEGSLCYVKTSDGNVRKAEFCLDNELSEQFTDQDTKEIIEDVSEWQFCEDCIDERATVNVEETNLFPHGEWRIEVWNVDSRVPIMHVIKDGWDVQIVIETGEVWGLLSRGEDPSVKDYIVEHIKEWLKGSSAVLDKITKHKIPNRKNVLAVWNCIRNPQ